MDATRAHRGLSTARAALRVTWLLARRPEGVRADEVAEALGKSVSTAYNVLASLCDEGVAERQPGGLYRLSAEFRETVAEESDRHDLSGVVDDLLARTHKRAYLAVLRGGQLRIVLERGLQGMPKLPGMNPEIADNAHALALGKVVLALGPRDAVEQYASAGLKRFTPATITEPDALLEELRHVRLSGVAAEQRGVRARLLLPGRRRARPRAPLPRRGRHLDVAPRLQRRASASRGDAARRRPIPTICRSSSRS